MSKTLPLTPYNLQRPEKILWRFPVTDDPLKVIKSKSLKQFLLNSESLLSEKKITWKLQPLDKNQFEDWLTYYQQKMTESSFDIIANKDWYDKKINQNKQVEGLFFYQDNKIIGSGIFVREGNEKATFAFKASDRIQIDVKGKGNLGSIIDYFYLREMVNQKVTTISLGRSRNAFGVFNTFGYLSFALRFGFFALPDATSGLTEEVPLNDEGIGLCYCLDGQNWILYAFRPKGVVHTFDIPNFIDEHLVFKEIEY